MLFSASARICRVALVASAFVVTAVVLAACGSNGPASGGKSFQGPVYEVTTNNLSNLGTILVDGKGFTLYLYEPDHQSGKSLCFDPCSVEWVPLTLPSGVTKPLAGAGVNASKLTTTQRRDGALQLVYNGWPLYTWAEDLAPGQVTGQGLDNQGGLWYVMNTAGNAITARA